MMMQCLSKELIDLSFSVFVPKISELLSNSRQRNKLLNQCREDIQRETMKWSENNGHSYIDTINQEACTPSIWQSIFDGMYNNLSIQFEE